MRVRLLCAGEAALRTKACFVDSIRGSRRSYILARAALVHVGAPQGANTAAHRSRVGSCGSAARREYGASDLLQRSSNRCFRGLRRSYINRRGLEAPGGSRSRLAPLLHKPARVRGAGGFVRGLRRSYTNRRGLGAPGVRSRLAPLLHKPARAWGAGGISFAACAAPTWWRGLRWRSRLAPLLHGARGRVGSCRSAARRERARDHRPLIAVRRTTGTGSRP